MDDAPASTALAARVATPISQLCPDLSEQQSRVVHGEVTICWPLNSVRQSFAFVIAEPDVRLRASHGQIRVQIDGPNAKAVSQSGLFSGDEVLLALDGAEWTENTYQDTRIPGSSSRWELRYPKGILLEFTSDSGETNTLDLHDAPPADVAAASSAAANFEVPIIDLDVPDAPPSPARLAEPDEYASPAFIKRARLSYGSLLDADNDLFEEDGWIKGKGRKKARYSTSWRYTSRSPSPEPSEDDAEKSAPAAAASDPPPVAHPLQSPGKPSMADDGCQVVEAELTPMETRDDPRASLSPAREQPPSPAKAQSAGTPQNPLEIDDGLADDGPARRTPDDEVSQPSASSSGEEPAQAHIAFPAARGVVAPSLGDYSSPRFAVNIPGTSAAYEGPSLEEQVRFGFHHSPASDQPATGPDVTHPVVFPRASAATTLVDNQQPQTIPLWNLGSSQVMDRDHVDAELNIDPALVAAEAPGSNTDDQTVTFARAEHPGLLDHNYNQRRFQNEAEEAMVVDAEDDAVKSPSDSYSNSEEAEYERELENEAGDDYDMRAYADVDDDVENDDIDQEQADNDDVEIFEGGGSYYSDEDEDQDRYDQEDEEGSYDEDGGGQSDAGIASSPMRRAPAQPPQQTGPIVIDLLSDSSDDEDGDTEPPVPPVSASARRPQHSGQRSPPSPSYEVYPDDRVTEYSEDSEDYEGSEDYEATEGSDIDAVGESEEESDELESRAQTTLFMDQPTSLADATRGNVSDVEVSDAEVSDDDQDEDKMQDEAADIAESSMDVPASPIVAAQSDKSNDSVGGDQTVDTTAAQPVDDKSKKPSLGDSKTPLVPSDPVRSPANGAGIGNAADTLASNPDLDSSSRVVSLEQGVDSAADSKDSAARSPADRAIEADHAEEEAVHIDEDDLLVVSPPVAQAVGSQDSAERRSAEKTASSPSAEDALYEKSMHVETVGQLPTPLDTQTEAVVEAQVPVDSMMQVDTQPSSQEDVEPSRETHFASSLEVTHTTTTITVAENIEVVELVGDDDSDEDSRSAASAGEEYEDEEMADAEAPEQEPEDDEMADVRSDGSGLSSVELEGATENVPTIDSSAAFATQEAPSTQDEPLPASNASEDGAGLEVANMASSAAEQSTPASPAHEPLPASSPAAENGRGQPATRLHEGFATQAPFSEDEYVNDDILTQTQETQHSAASSIPSAAPDRPVPTHHEKPSRIASQEPLSENDQEMDDAQSDKSMSAPDDSDESEDDASIKIAEGVDAASDRDPDSASLDIGANDLQKSINSKATPSRPGNFKSGIRGEHRVNDALQSPAQEDPRGSVGTRGAGMEVAASFSPEPVRASREVSGAITVRTDDETPTRRASRHAKTPAMPDPSIKLARAATGVSRGMSSVEIHPDLRSPNQPTTPAANLAASSPWSARPSPNITGQPGFKPRLGEYNETGRVVDKASPKTAEQVSKLRHLEVITSILGPDWGGSGGTPPLTISPRAANEVKKMAEAAQQSLPPALFEYLRAHLWTVPPENCLDELQGFFVRCFPDGTFPERKAVNARKEICRIIKSRTNLNPRSETPQKTQDPSLKLARAALNSPSRNLRASTSGDGDGDAAPPEATATTITGLKLEIGRFFRGNMADYTTLISLRAHPGKQLNVVGVVTAASKQPVRTKARQYAMSISITDHTISPGNVVEVQFYRLHREALPVTKPGDRVLLRNFTVVGLTGRGQGLRSNDASEYAVFDDKREEAGGNSSLHEHEDNDDNDEGGSSTTHQMAQLRGGPIELENYEYEIAHLLKNWYNLLPPASKEKLEKANRKLAAGGAAISVES